MGIPFRTGLQASDNPYRGVAAGTWVDQMDGVVYGGPEWLGRVDLSSTLTRSTESRVTLPFVSGLRPGCQPRGSNPGRRA